MSVQSEIDLQRRLDQMKLDVKISSTLLLLKRAVGIIQAAADAGNVQCKAGLEELHKLCPPTTSSTSSESAT